MSIGRSVGCDPNTEATLSDRAIAVCSRRREFTQSMGHTALAARTAASCGGGPLVPGERLKSGARPSAPGRADELFPPPSQVRNRFTPLGSHAARRAEHKPERSIKLRLNYRGASNDRNNRAQKGPQPASPHVPRNASDTARFVGNAPLSGLCPKTSLQPYNAGFDKIKNGKNDLSVWLSCYLKLLYRIRFPEKILPMLCHKNHKARPTKRWLCSLCRVHTIQY